MCAYGTYRHPRGAALVIALLVLAVLLLAGTTFLTISSTESLIAMNKRASTQAFSLAEAGIHKAIAKLNTTPGYEGETNTPLGSGTFTVTATPVDGCARGSARILLATGLVPVRGGQAQVKLQVTVDRIFFPFLWAAFATVPDGVIAFPNQKILNDDRSDKELWIRNNGAVDSFDSSQGLYDAKKESGDDGNIGANGDVTLDNHVQVSGSVSARADKSFPPVTPPVTPREGLAVGQGETVALPGGDPVNCDANTRTCYYTHMSLGNKAKLTTSGGPVTIYVTGPVSVGENVTLGDHPATQLQLITKSDLPDNQSIPFTAGNNFILYGSLYGKSTDIHIMNNVQIYGSVIARTISMWNNAAIHYDQALATRRACHSGKFNIVLGTWREVIPSY